MSFAGLLMMFLDFFIYTFLGWYLDNGNARASLGLCFQLFIPCSGSYLHSDPV
jgi:hypothetical protein